MATSEKRTCFDAGKFGFCHCAAENFGQNWRAKKIWVEPPQLGFWKKFGLSRLNSRFKKKMVELAQLGFWNKFGLSRLNSVFEKNWGLSRLNSVSTTLLTTRGTTKIFSTLFFQVRELLSYGTLPTYQKEAHVCLEEIKIEGKPPLMGLGISRTNAYSQWNPVFNAFYRIFGCGNETIMSHQ